MSRSLMLALCLIGCPRPTPTPPDNPGLAVLVSREPLVRTNALDKRKYRAFELENGMRALVISDPDVDMAAASVRVAIGHYSDPADRAGLAHFLEHMLFMGSEKYPDPAEYRKFIEEHGGGTNAGTGTESTEYHFNIAHEQLEPAFDRMAQFFLSPILDPAYVDRERNAVHSEYLLKVKDEARRIREVRKKTCNPEHPCENFSVGTNETLADRGEDTVYEDLRAFYAAEYSASRMAVSIIGRESVDVLEQMVREKLSGVPTDGKPQPAFGVPAYTEDELGVRIHIVPLAERRTLKLEFLVPVERPHYEKHPISTLTGLIGHEGTGSLLSLLKSKGLAESLSAGGDGSSDHSLVTISVGLTEEGFAKVDDVTDYIFQYIRLLGRDGVDPVYYAENQKLSQLSFAYRTAPRPTSAVTSATYALLEYPPEHVLSYWAEYADYDADLVADYLARLVPSNARQIVMGPGLETDKVEVRYDVPYAMKPLDAALIERWTSSPIDPELALPAPNPYIPEDLALRDGPKPAPKPTLLAETEKSELWYGLDIDFGTPSAMVRLGLFSPAPRSEGLSSRVKSMLYAALVEESLNEFTYPIQLAGLGYSVSTSSWGLEIATSGYDGKQPELLSEVLGRLPLKIDPAHFELRKTRMIRAWRNSVRDRPISQNMRRMSQLLVPAAIDRLAAADALEKVTVDDLQEFIDHFFDATYAQMIVYGNMSESTARELMAQVDTAILAKASPYDIGDYTTRTVPPGQELLHTMAVDHADSTISVAWMGRDGSLGEHARVSIAAALWSEPFFSQLRTEQQLGYTVWSFARGVDDLPTLRAAIQSPKLGPTGLLERIDAFAKNYRETLTAMTDEEYATIRAGLVASLTEADTAIGSRMSRYDSDLWRGFRTLDRREQLVAAIEKVDRADMLAFFDAVVLGEERARLVVRSVGGAHTESETSKAGCDTVACTTKKLGERSRDLTP